MLELAIFMVLFIGIAVYFARRRMYGANLAVIRSFRNHGAVTPESAKSLSDLGLAPRQGLKVGLRDYKPFALQFMMQTNIVRLTDDGRYFLCEDTLSTTNLAAVKE